METRQTMRKMNNRMRTLAILNYEPYDRLPVVHFGFWVKTLAKWAAEGHITEAEAKGWGDGNRIDAAIGQRLGFDFNWASTLGWNTRLFPPIEKRVVEEKPDGSRIVLNEDGGFVVEKLGIVSIPTEVDHMLKSRKEWDEFFKPRLQFDMQRINRVVVNLDGSSLPFSQGGCELLQAQERSNPCGLFCGSLFGVIRDWLGLSR
jgi:uroporphyrinogen decarboxylase